MEVIEYVIQPWIGTQKTIVRVNEQNRIATHINNTGQKGLSKQKDNCQREHFSAIGAKNIKYGI